MNTVLVELVREMRAKAGEYRESDTIAERLRGWADRLESALATLAASTPASGEPVAWQMRFVGPASDHPERRWQTSNARPEQWYFDHPEYWEVRALFATPQSVGLSESEREVFRHLHETGYIDPDDADTFNAVVRRLAALGDSK